MTRQPADTLGKYIHWYHTRGHAIKCGCAHQHVCVLGLWLSECNTLGGCIVLFRLSRERQRGHKKAGFRWRSANVCAPQQELRRGSVPFRCSCDESQARMLGKRVSERLRIAPCFTISDGSTALERARSIAAVRLPTSVYQCVFMYLENL